MMNEKIKKILLGVLFFIASAKAVSAEVTTSTLTVSPTEVTPGAVAASSSAAASSSIPAPALPTAKNYATRDLITSEVKIYKFSFFSLAGGRTNDIGKGGTSLGSYNYFGLSRMIK